MIGHMVNTDIGGSLTITSLVPFGDKGGQGKVYQTNSKYLIKIWDPFEPPSDPGAERKEMEKRYSTFSKLGFQHESELRCLPLEYKEVDGQPTYVMECATGKEMAEEWESLMELSLVQRLRIAYSLANGISVLHSHGVVHADIKRDNFFFDPQTLSIQVLDIDGGGYFGTESQGKRFPPSVTPIARYMSPELHKSNFSWGRIWENDKRKVQPDLWALAVLIYDIVVDREGPFPQQYFGRTGAFIDHPDWPSSTQKDKLRGLGIDPRLIELFTEVFCSANRTRFDYQRPLAIHWSQRLRYAIDTRLPKSLKCSRGHTIEDPSYLICPRCAGQNVIMPIWGYVTCSKQHRTPAKSPYYPSHAYCKECGEEIT